MDLAKGNRVIRGIRSDVREGLVRESRKCLSVEKEGAERKLPVSLLRFDFLMSSSENRIAGQPSDARPISNGSSA